MLSIGILVIMSSWLQVESTKLLETSEILDNFGNLADTDIQIILGEDSAKYETAYSYLNELYFLNDKYSAMIEYNQTHPLNYTQLDFDEIKLDFTAKMRTVNAIVQSTSVYEYSAIQLGASVVNNYTYLGFDFFFITNQWVKWTGSYEEIHGDIRNYVNASFVSSGDPLDLPKIKFETWTYHLYNNLSVLEFVGPSKSISYINNHLETTGLNLVNLSLTQLTEYRDSYVILNEKVDTIYQDFNNTLITLALAGVLMGFATSFDSKNLRRISIIVGLIVLILALVYFISAFATLAHLSGNEAGIIGVNEFVFI
jgi:hypothetical protein